MAIGLSSKSPCRNDLNSIAVMRRMGANVHKTAIAAVESITVLAFCYICMLAILRIVKFGIRKALSILVLLALLCPFCCPAQQLPFSGFGIEANEFVGKVFKHEPKFTLPIPALSTATDINLMLHTYGRKPWEQRTHYPTIGFAFVYINYGMDAVYGRCYGMYPNITLPVISSRNWEWTIRLGEGLSYVSRTFQRTAPVDTINVAIGTHINGITTFMTDLRYHVSDHWDVQLGAGATHISDASYGKPNLGINVAGAHVGVRYFPVTSKPMRIHDTLPKLSNRWLAEARVSMAMTARNTNGGPLYPVYIASVYASRRWHNVDKYFVGADYYYHEDIYAYLRNTGLAAGHEVANSYQAAVFAGNEFLLGRFGILLQMGAYLHQTYVKLDPVYEKVGGQYYIVQKEHGFVKELFLSVFLKTHQTVAELAEFGVGVGF